MPRETTATIYTDISATLTEGNGGIYTHGAYAYWIRHQSGRLIGGGTIPIEFMKSTNDMEMYGVYAGISKAVKALGRSLVKVYVRTDNKSVAQFLTSNGGASQLGRYITRRLKEVGIELHAKWIKGHQTDDSTQTFINTAVDVISRSIRKGKDYRQHLPPQYHDIEINPSPPLPPFVEEARARKLIANTASRLLGGANVAHIEDAIVVSIVGDDHDVQTIISD